MDRLLDALTSLPTCIYKPLVTPQFTAFLVFSDCTLGRPYGDTTACFTTLQGDPDPTLFAGESERSDRSHRQDWWYCRPDFVHRPHDSFLPPTRHRRTTQTGVSLPLRLCPDFVSFTVPPVRGASISHVSRRSLQRLSSSPSRVVSLSPWLPPSLLLRGR